MRTDKNIKQNTKKMLTDEEIQKAMNRLNTELRPIFKENSLKKEKSIRASEQIILSI